MAVGRGTEAAVSRKGDAMQMLLIDLYAEGVDYEQEYRFDSDRKWRFDIAMPAQKLAVEVDGGIWVGGRHTSGVGYEKDCQKLNAAVLQGWRVLRFTSGMVRSGEAARTIMMAYGVERVR